MGNPAYQLEVEGVNALQPGPLVVLMRHASLADTLLPAVVIASHGIRLRYVLKRELLWDPCRASGGYQGGAAASEKGRSVSFPGLSFLSSNDWWRMPDPLDGGSVEDCVHRATVPGPSAERVPSEPWRMVRALRLLAQWLPIPPGQLWRALPPRRPELDPAWQTGLAENLRGIVACVRKAGSQPVLLTYPAAYGPYGLANQTIRAAASAEAVHLVDLADGMAARCPRHECDFLFPVPDQHPTAAGHAWIGEMLAAQLAPELMAATTRPVSHPSHPRSTPLTAARLRP